MRPLPHFTLIMNEAKHQALKHGFFVLQRSGKLIHTDDAEQLIVL